LCIRKCYEETNFLEGILFDTPFAAKVTRLLTVIAQVI